MTISFHYKGLSAEDRLFPQEPKQSAALAKGTLYEAWFDTLQTSPWHAEISRTGMFPDECAEKNWRLFGDLTGLTFTKWWMKTGYRIFAEEVAYRPVAATELEHEVSFDKDDKRPPTLTLEIPLNLSPKALEEQFKKILKAHENYQYEFDRWKHSTAAVHQQRETKLTYGSIKRWLDLYKDWEREKAMNPELTQFEYSIKNNLVPNARRKIDLAAKMDETERAVFANALSDQLKQARNLMANATVGIFPDTTPHPWATSSGRKSKKED